MNGDDADGVFGALHFAQKTALAVTKVFDISLLGVPVESDDVERANVDADVAADAAFRIDVTYSHG